MKGKASSEPMAKRLSYLEGGQRLDPRAFALSVGFINAAATLILEMVSVTGFYGGMADLTNHSFILLSSTPAGIILGMIEVAIVSGFIAFLIAALYNKMVGRPEEFGKENREYKF